jgi:hypothetical protein
VPGLRDGCYWREFGTRCGTAVGTISALEEPEDIGPEHVAEAIQ